MLQVCVLFQTAWKWCVAPGIKAAVSQWPAPLRNRENKTGTHLQEGRDLGKASSIFSGVVHLSGHALHMSTHENTSAWLWTHTHTHTDQCIHKERMKT